MMIDPVASPGGIFQGSHPLRHDNCNFVVVDADVDVDVDVDVVVVVAVFRRSIPLLVRRRQAEGINKRRQDAQHRIDDYLNDAVSYYRRFTVGPGRSSRISLDDISDRLLCRLT